MTPVIYMVRHAKSPFKFGEEKTRRLSKEGEIDAKKVTELLIDKDIDVIVSSSYTRAVQTVQALAMHKGLTIKEYDELKEGPIKGLDYKLSEDEILEAIKLSFEDKNYCLSGGESTLQAQNRSIPIIKNLLKDYEGKNIVIGTHGNIMTIIMNYFDDRYGYDFWKSTSKPDIYKLEFKNESLIKVKRLWS
ncbi:histidine phosphatase family protein [Bacillus sp. DX1.1]|uniref:histidine phosphatase family protein n=1 Tax=unclassified Bacillus (in: firmicutes) TaxID=185979 RepID=UPI00256FEA63|nr:MULTISPECIES: histidine phosphatase family protein [unclassified Bacillus (in: firmicutes)]MDM5155133.1 histidine phosphatase family protein [Bacillus sp. DX1.1]WJE79461.1 histidine phosphatase family protein [Bacillus sp. DX3.1]